MTQVTSLGFIRTRLDERLAQLVADYKAIYGDDIMVEPDDLDGEFLGIMSERFSDIDQLAEDVYNSFNPQNATGVALSRLVELNSIRRIAGEYSVVDVTLGGTVGITVPSGSLVKSTIDNTTWETTADAVIGAGGIATVSVRRTEKDSTTAAPNTLTKIDTPVYGWQTVTNAQAALPGRKEETDEQLRTRRKSSTSTAGQSILDSIYGAISNLPAVRLLKVYENDTDATDANGQPEHSIYAIVEGGVAADIAQVIFRKKTAGTSTVGSIEQTVTDIQGNPHTIRFDRPVYSDLYITVTITAFANYPVDGDDRIKAALVDWAVNGDTGDDAVGLGIGEEVVPSRMYDAVNTVPFHAVSSIAVDVTPAPVNTAPIAVPFNGLARIDASRIVVVQL